LKKEGATAEVIAPHLGELKGDIQVDKSFATAKSVMYDAVYVPGGKESTAMLAGDYEARNFVREAYNHGKAIGASGEGAELLQAAGVGAAPGVVIEKAGTDVAKAFSEAITQHRHWNRPIGKWRMVRFSEPENFLATGMAKQRRSEMKTAAMIVGLVGGMFVTGTYVIAQSEPPNQTLGAAGASPETDKDVGQAGGRNSTHQKLGTLGASPESDKDIGAPGAGNSTHQKLGAPGAAAQSDKNIGPGATDSTTGSDNKSTNRRSAPPTGKK
jgi:putative intracellular protease/amidase